MCSILRRLKGEKTIPILKTMKVDLVQEVHNEKNIFFYLSFCVAKQH